MPRYGITTTFVDMCDLAATRAAVAPNTKMFWAETPTNPLLRIIDIAAIAALKAPGQIVAADNTFPTPYRQQPLALGADVVIFTSLRRSRCAVSAASFRFEVRAGRASALEFAKSLSAFSLATSLGGVESLVSSPPAMSHASLSPALKAKLGITEDLLRLSVESKMRPI